MAKERIIAFHRANKVGDNVVAIKALYALKMLYPDFKLMVLTNGIGEALYRHLGFIDYLFDIDKSAEMAKVREIELEFLIITHKCPPNIALAKSLNARKIIMYAHAYNLFAPRFQVIFPRGIKSHHESENLLYLVRAINKAHFDKNFPLIDFSQAHLVAGAENKAFVEAFFAEQKLGKDSQATKSACNDTTSHCEEVKPTKQSTKNLKQPNSVAESTESQQPKMVKYVREAGNKAEFISAQLEAERSSQEFTLVSDTFGGIKEIDSQTTKQGGRIQDSNQLEMAEYERGAEPSGIHFREGDTINGIVAINIFASCQKPCNFSLTEWVEIINTLCARFAKSNFILTSFVGAPYDLHACKELSAPNCKIFVNNADILNLIALFERVDALISVDTGNIHIADNMRLPTFGLYNKAVLKRWGGGSYGGVFEAFCVENAPKVGDKELFTQKVIAFLERVCVS